MKNVKTIAALLLCLGLLSPASVLYAAPQGGKVVGGKASITQSGATTTINQTTDRSVINWHSFNIGLNEKVLHNMPSKNSAGLHRVVGGGGASQIQGLLQSNGNIFVVNPAGVVIHKGAKVDTNSFLATTRDITDDNFMKGNMVFDKPGLANAQIINQGTITVNDRGLAALVAPTVRNEGLIVGKLGKVALASGDSTWKLDMYGDDLISFTVDEKAVNGLYAPSGQTLGVENTGTIKAEGGVVVLTAAQLDGIVGSVVNSGEISASSAEIAGGKITFKGQGDSIILANIGKVDASSTTSKGGSVKMVAENDIKVSGKIDVNGGTAGGDVYIWSDKKTTFDGKIEAKGKDKGGFVETSGNYLKVADSARVYALADSGRHGEWLLDPVDYVIGSNGVMTGAQLSAKLADTNMTIRSNAGNTQDGNGDIIINDAVSWSSDTTLTLDAERNIEVNADITATGNNAGLSMAMENGNYYLNDAKITLLGDTPHLSINGSSYTIISSIESLQSIDGNPYGKYALGNSINASDTSKWCNGKGFNPISQFSGIFEGNGNWIYNLHINRSDESSVALFRSATYDSEIKNINISNIYVNGKYCVGGLVGANYGKINNVYISGEIISRTYNTPGLGNQVGGVAGYNHYDGIIQYAAADVEVEGYSVGGIAGCNNGTISNSSSMGTVVGIPSGDINIESGGLAGFSNGIIKECYSLSSVNGYVHVGGLVGRDNGNIYDSYSSGSVSGNNRVGGLVGYCRENSDIYRSYSVSKINSNGSILGGLIGGSFYYHGYEYDKSYGSYYEKDENNDNVNRHGNAKNKNQLQLKETFVDWDFDGVWSIENGKNYPKLRNVKNVIGVDIPAIPSPPTTPDRPGTPVVPPVTPDEPDAPITPDTPASPEEPTPGNPYPDSPFLPVNPAQPDSSYLDPINTSDKVYTIENGQGVTTGGFEVQVSADLNVLNQNEERLESLENINASFFEEFIKDATWNLGLTATRIELYTIASYLNPFSWIESSVNYIGDMVLSYTGQEEKHKDKILNSNSYRVQIGFYMLIEEWINYSNYYLAMAKQSLENAKYDPNAMQNYYSYMKQAEVCSEMARNIFYNKKDDITDEFNRFAWNEAGTTVSGMIVGIGAGEGMPKSDNVLVDGVFNAVTKNNENAVKDGVAFDNVVDAQYILHECHSGMTLNDSFFQVEKSFERKFNNMIS